MTSKNADIYKQQRRYFRQAYISGKHGWPVAGATPEVRLFLGKIAGKCSLKRAVDIGCGEGRHAILLAKRGFKVTAFDLEPLALVKAKGFAAKAGVAKTIAFRAGDALKIELPAEAFDVAIDYGCFHHLLKRDWQRYFRVLDRILRDKGFFIISLFTPKFKHKDGGTPLHRNWTIHKGHYDHFFTPTAVRKTFASRFDILDLRVDADGFCHALLQKKNSKS